MRGRVYSLAVAGGQLFASTDSGSIHCFRPSGKGVPSNLSRRTEARGAEQTTPLVPTNPGRPLARDAGLVNWWKFRVGMDAPARRRGFPNPERHVGDLVGGLRATIVGDVQLRQLGSLEALAFDGLTNSVTVMRDARAADLPEEEMSAEAWVRSDEPSQRGGIVGVSEMAKRRGLGWQLGYRESKFFFALKSVRERKTEKGDPLTFVEGDVNIQKGAWYHVVGTYDGTTQRLYVNGREEKVASEERGSIRYSEQPRYEIGNYRFKSLDSRLSGLLEEVRVYQRALSPDEISQRYEERRELFPEPVRLALGPDAEFVGPETAIVRWHTRTPSPTRLEYRSGDKLFTVSDSVPKIEHEARLSQLQRDRIAQYWVKTGRERQRSTPVFELAGHFHYSVPRVQEVSIPSAANDTLVDWTALAEQLLVNLSRPGVGERSTCLRDSPPQRLARRRCGHRSGQGGVGERDSAALWCLWDTRRTSRSGIALETAIYVVVCQPRRFPIDRRRRSPRERRSRGVARTPSGRRSGCPWTPRSWEGRVSQ